MEIIVLGAGIVGISTAVHLQKRGNSVLLVDRDEPAMAASFGNAGMLHGEAVMPLPFPRSFDEIIHFGLNQTPALHYHLRALPDLAPFLLKYWWHSSPKRHLEISKGYAALTGSSLAAHLELATEADAMSFIRQDGCYTVLRKNAGVEKELRATQLAARHFTVNYSILGAEEFSKIEPDLKGLSGAIHWNDSLTVRDPRDLVLSYFNLFKSLGGIFRRGIAENIQITDHGWSLQHDEGRESADSIVVALGARSATWSRTLGYQFPLKPKRGYHMHYAVDAGQTLNNTIIDRDNGFSLAPMSRGIRLTTGIEFANLNAAPSPVQLGRSENAARKMFDLGERLDDTPWMGERPCLPDMLPVIGKAPDRDNLWFAFGHGHQGLTMGPATGKLIAEMISGEAPGLDPTPYAPQRFWS